jgi:diguanylate cyclase (GGDEF)-like protein
VGAPIDRLHGLRDFARAATTAESVAELADRSAEAALALLDADSVSISQLEPALGQVRVLRNAGALAEWEHETPADETYPAHTYPRIKELAGGGVDGWTDSLDDPATDPADVALLRSLGKRHSAGFGVLVADHAWGELFATRTGGEPFGREDMATGFTLVQLLSSGLARLELLADLSRLAFTDPLTGLGNRRAGDQWLERRLAAPEPFAPVSIVLCDINGLKQINDSFGHTAGDALIRLVAQQLSAAAGQSPDALAVRVGGDEFVLLMDGASVEQVDSVVAQLASTRLPHGSGIAVGAATTTTRPAGSTSPTTAIRALMRLADAAQYRHKQTRRASSHLSPAPGAAVAVLYPQGADDLADLVLDQLNRSVDRSVEWRLLTVADAIAEAFSVSSWWVSRCDDDVLGDVLGRIVRHDSQGELAQPDWASGSEFQPDQYPATARALAGGSYYASLTEGDHAERAFLARLGAVSALAAGDRDSQGRQWLLELLGDPRTSVGLAIARPLLRTLVHVAVREADAL